MYSEHFQRSPARKDPFCGCRIPKLYTLKGAAFFALDWPCGAALAPCLSLRVRPRTGAAMRFFSRMTDSLCKGGYHPPAAGCIPAHKDADAALGPVSFLCLARKILDRKNRL